MRPPARRARLAAASPRRLRQGTTCRGAGSAVRARKRCGKHATAAAAYPRLMLVPACWLQIHNPGALPRAAACNRVHAHQPRCAPDCAMRRCSSGSEGLASHVRGTTSTSLQQQPSPALPPWPWLPWPLCPWPPGLRRATTQRESPVDATSTLRPTTRTQQAVVPDKEASKPACGRGATRGRGSAAGVSRAGRAGAAGPCMASPAAAVMPREGSCVCLQPCGQLRSSPATQTHAQ